jgi:hypothetical protein
MKLRILLACIFSSCLLQLMADSKPARAFQYFPEGKDVVCINGNNRYTRALYGTHTLFRLETSDRPIFASYNNEKSKNFRFYLKNKGKTLRLDSTSYCEARYQGGRRSYIVKDASWGRRRVAHCRPCIPIQ